MQLGVYVKKLIWTAAICLVLPLAGWAQGSNGNIVSDTARGIVAHYAKILEATAKEMPANKYSYRPTPKQRTFGETMAHIAQSNVFMCSKLSDVPAPKMEPSASDSKDKLVEDVHSSFDYCDQSLAKLQDSQLGDKITFFGGHPATRAVDLFALTDDLYDHYAQMAIYLRLNGLLPPTAHHM
jgi:DinB superfamily